MLFFDACEYFNKIEITSSRLQTAEILHELYSKTVNEDLTTITYFLQGRIFPSYKSYSFNLAEKHLKNIFIQFNPSLEDNYNVTVLDNIDKFLVMNENIKPTLSIKKIRETLESVSSISGKNHTEKKSEIIISTLELLTPIEAKWFTRLLLQKMRLGISNKGIMDSFMVGLSKDEKKKAKVMLENAYGFQSDMGQIAFLLRSAKDIETAIGHISPEIGIPISPKLVERASNMDEVVDRINPVIIQPKFDDLRFQIHFDEKKNIIKFFSRNLEDITESFPDIMISFNEFAKSNNIEKGVFDSEIVAVDSEGKYLQFSEIMKRKRKNDIELFSAEIDSQVNIFDVITYNGVDIWQNNLSERLHLLKSLTYNKKIKIAETYEINTKEDGQEIFDKYVLENRLEGIIAKNPSGKYMPGTRNFEWIKLKRSSQSNLNDSIDAVIIGYYIGRGAREKLGIGGLLLGIIDNEGKITPCTKLGTGFTEEEITNYKKMLDKNSISDNTEIEKYYSDIKNIKESCDVIVLPKIVLEIEGDEISESSKYICGYSLRFPRIIKLRTDKNIDEATHTSEIQNMYIKRFKK